MPRRVGLTLLSLRATRAADLLRTRVDVALQAQNQSLLESMDSRSALQLRLQQTVEGLSVVAISYYAVGLSQLFGETTRRSHGSRPAVCAGRDHPTRDLDRVVVRPAHPAPARDAVGVDWRFRSGCPRPGRIKSSRPAVLLVRKSLRHLSGIVDVQRPDLPG